MDNYSSDVPRKRIEAILKKLKTKYWFSLLYFGLLFAGAKFWKEFVEIFPQETVIAIENSINSLGPIAIVAFIKIEIFLTLLFFIPVLYLWLRERTLRLYLESKFPSAGVSNDSSQLSEALIEIREQVSKLASIDRLPIGVGARQQVESLGRFYSLFQELLVTPRRADIYVVGLNPDWAYKLLFSLFVSRTLNNRIIILCDINEVSLRRYRLVAALGCRLVPVENTDLSKQFRGIIVNPEDSSDCHAVLIYQDEIPRYGTYYATEIDSIAIRHFYVAVENVLKTSDTYNSIEDYDYVPELQLVSKEATLAGMRKIDFYRNANFEFRSVTVSEVIPVSTFVEQFKVQQAKEIFAFFRSMELNPFAPIAIKLKGDFLSTVLPPILEEKNGLLYIAEGHTRFFHLFKNDPEKQVEVIVVKGVAERFSREPTTWDQVEVLLDKRTGGENMYEYARKIEGQFRDDIFDQLPVPSS